MTGPQPTPSAEVNALVVSHSGQCCPGYCVEDIDLHNIDPATAQVAARGAAAYVQAARDEERARCAAEIRSSVEYGSAAVDDDIREAWRALGDAFARLLAREARGGAR